MEEINVEIKNEDIDFETAMKIAEAMAERNQRQIKGWWDHLTGEHSPHEWREEEFDVEINVNDEYSFYF